MLALALNSGSALIPLVSVERAAAPGLHGLITVVNIVFLWVYLSRLLLALPVSKVIAPDTPRS
jgi:hypothetical protein